MNSSQLVMTAFDILRNVADSGEKKREKNATKREWDLNYNGLWKWQCIHMYEVTFSLCTTASFVWFLSWYSRHGYFHFNILSVCTRHWMKYLTISFFTCINYNANYIKIYFNNFCYFRTYRRSCHTVFQEDNFTV